MGFAIAAMRISVGAPQRSRGRRRGLDAFVPKPFTCEKPEALIFKVSGFSQHAFGQFVSTLRSCAAQRQAAALFRCGAGFLRHGFYDGPPEFRRMPFVCCSLLTEETPRLPDRISPLPASGALPETRLPFCPLAVILPGLYESGVFPFTVA